MIHFPKISSLRVAAAIMMATILLPAKAQTISPANNAQIKEISTITITFSSNVTLNNIDGIYMTLGNKFYPISETERGFSVTTSGRVATITLDRPFVNLYAFEQWGYILCEAGTFRTGNTDSREISANWTFPGTDASVPDDPVLSPRRGSTNLTLSEVSIEWPGCGVEIAGQDYNLEDVKFGVRGSNFSHANIASIVTGGEKTALGDSKLIIRVQNSQNGNQPFNTPGEYILALAEDVVRINTPDGSVMFPGDDFTFFISDYTLSPQPNEELTEWQGITFAGKNISIVNPKGIQLYYKYFDIQAVPDPAEGELPFGYGDTTTPTTFEGSDAVHLSFKLDREIYNGPHTVIVPAGAILVDGKPINDNLPLYLNYMVIDNLMPLPVMVCDPAEGPVPYLDLCNVVWGLRETDPQALYDFYGEMITVTYGGGLNVALTLPDGKTEQLLCGVITVTDDNEDIDQLRTLGSFLKIQFDRAYTAEGEYVITIPGDRMTVDFNSYNIIPVPETKIRYTIGDVLNSVGSPAVENETVDVYNMLGVKLLSGASKADLEKLPRGIYVVNGVKTVAGN